MRKLIFITIAILALSFTANAQRYTKYVFEPANGAWYCNTHRIWETDLKYSEVEIEITSYKVTVENGREVGERIPVSWSIDAFDNRYVAVTKLGSNTLFIRYLWNPRDPSFEGSATMLGNSVGDRLDIWSWFPGTNPY